MPIVIETATATTPRYGFTVDEVRRMCDAGVLSWDDRFELIEGELRPMAPLDNPHGVMKRWLLRTVMNAAGASAWVDSEPAVCLDPPRTYVNPDIVVYPLGILPEDVRGPDVLLIIEVADSSLDYDLGAKAALYARCGVRDYWVVNALTGEVRIHRSPAAAGFEQIVDAGADETLVPLLIDGLTIRTKDAL